MKMKIERVLNNRYGFDPHKNSIVAKEIAELVDKRVHELEKELHITINGIAALTTLIEACDPVREVSLVAGEWRRHLRITKDVLKGTGKATPAEVIEDVIRAFETGAITLWTENDIDILRKAIQEE